MPQYITLMISRQKGLLVVAAGGALETAVDTDAGVESGLTAVVEAAGVSEPARAAANAGAMSELNKLLYYNLFLDFLISE